MANATERALRRKRKRDAAAAKRIPLHLKNKANPKKGIKKKPSAAANPNRVPLGDNAFLEAKGLDVKRRRKKKGDKEKKGENENEENKDTSAGEAKDESFLLSTAPATRQLRFFLNRFHSATGFKLSTLELEAFKETCIVELPQGINQDVQNFCKTVKDYFQNSWKEALCNGTLLEGKIDPGSPTILIVSASSLRSLELLRGLKPLTRECRPAKLFAKHMKLEEQITLLKNRVNIATGTPNRIKKLIDIDALGLSQLALVVIDMQRDAKGYSLFTLPQVSNEFWELYKSHFHQRILQGDLHICFYGPTSVLEFEKALQTEE